MLLTLNPRTTPRKMRLTFLICLLATERGCGFPLRAAFRTSRDSLPSLTSAVSPRGTGMGMGANTKGGTKKKNGKVKQPSNPPYDVSASLLRLDKKYEELQLAAAKTLQKEFESDDDLVTTEYIITARASPIVADWVPVAQLCLARTQADAHASEGAADPTLQAAVSLYCRELSHVAGMGSRLFQSVARNELQYAVESMDSFHKHVYEVVLEGKNENTKNENVMTKTEARSVLQLEVDVVDKSEIKRVYRKMSMAWHPDRFVGKDLTDEEMKEASVMYSKIKLAYETLESGIREIGKSWYESLGGRARTDFHGPVRLSPISEAKALLEASKVSSAVVGLDPEMVQGFVARSQAGV